MGGICFIMYVWLDEIVWYLFRVNIPSTKLSNKHAKNKYTRNGLYSFIMSSICCR